MFKKRCPKCERKINKEHKFCPFCGNNLKSKYNKKDYGFLGKDDFDDSFNSMFTNLPMNKLFKTAMKMSEKMIKDIQKQQFNQPKEHYNNSNMDIQFFVNGKKVFPEKQQIQKIQKPVKVKTTISDEKAKKFAKLPRKTPKTKMKRIGNKLIYEFLTPGVNNINDILINQLENSIEIKALSKNKVYSKIINLNLPIISYKLEQDNLILELQAK